VPSVILDADGVFLSERPYWNAALATALLRAGLAETVGDGWEVLAEAAFGAVGLQRVTKARGCNSNWDLAAALDLALSRRAARDALRQLLAAGRGPEAMERLRDEAASLARPAAASGDVLLEAFGIDRRGSGYAEVVGDYQRVLRGEAEVAWPFPRVALREPHAETRAAFARCVEAGYDLRVCTGRHREEIDGPIHQLGLRDLLPPEKVTSGTEVDRAQVLTGERSLAKPHWFPPACAAEGFDRAVRAVRGEVFEQSRGSAVYVGDAWADWEAVRAARHMGLRLHYIHVRSPAATTDQQRAIARAPGTLGVVDGLGEVAGLLPGAEA